MVKSNRKIETRNGVTRIECTECHQMLPADTEHYFKGDCALGLRSKCKNCVNKKYKEKAIEYREENREKINAQKREAHKRDREIISERRKQKKEQMKIRRKQYYETHKEKEMEYNRNRKRETGKGKLWTKTERLIKKIGIIHDWCSICGGMGQTQAHHPNYKKRNEVIFLCPSCHQRVHAGRIECPKEEIIDLLLIDKFNEMSKDRTGIEIPGRYDGIAYYVDKEGNRYSRKGNPIEKDEVCRYGEIFKVEFYDDRGVKYKILSRRPDGDGNKPTEV